MTSLGDTLGTGLAFAPDWDVETSAGSIDTISGVDVLGRDLAWALIIATDEAGLRGQRPTPELLEDTRVVAKRVATAEERVDRIESLDVRATDDAFATAEVALEVDVADDVTPSFVFTV